MDRSQQRSGNRQYKETLAECKDSDEVKEKKKERWSERKSDGKKEDLSKNDVIENIMRG